MVSKWESQYGALKHILTTGDNNYWDGACSTIDGNIGNVYGSYFTKGSCVEPRKGFSSLANATGQQIAVDARFWPVPGNHDFDKYQYNNMIPYLQYFPHLAQYAPTMNGRSDYGKGMFYNVVLPNMDDMVSVFALNSNVGGDPSNIDRMAYYNFQKDWLRQTMSASKAPFNLVTFHHAPFTSAQRDRATTWMRPAAGMSYKEWGASAVITGHQHVYERVIGTDGMLYLVNGLGGHERLYGVSVANGCAQIEGSQISYNDFHGFQIAVATPEQLDICMYVIPNGKVTVLDSVTIPRSKSAPAYTPPGSTAPSGISGGTILCIIFIVSLALYIGIGVTWQYKRNDARGLDLIPNREFWSSTLPGLVKDGCIFSYKFTKAHTWDRGGYTTY
jgi:hypothetical protein